jgi:glutamyl-tRNA synthetase
MADLEKEGLQISQEKAGQIAHIMKERATFPADLWKEGKFMLIAPTEFDEAVASKKWNQEAVTVLNAYHEKLSAFEGELSPETAKTLLEQAAETNGIKLGKVMQAVRLAVTGVGAGPDLMAVFSIIGREELIKRIGFAVETLPVQG